LSYFWVIFFVHKKVRKGKYIFWIVQIYFMAPQESFCLHNIITAAKGIAGMLNSIQYCNDVLAEGSSPQRRVV
jgi:hypothetical protein